MKKLFDLYKFAIKSAWAYKSNFIISLIAVIVNDSLFFLFYIIYLNYFNNWPLGITDFLLAWWIFTFWFAIIEGFFAKITELGEIIEEGKLDWYLSYPINPLKLISLSKFDPGASGDLLFSMIMFWFYFFIKWFSLISIIKVIFVCIVWSFFILWLGILVGSISFFIQRASLWATYIYHIYWTIGSYPYKVFFKNIVIVVLATLSGLLPSGILWQLIILSPYFSYKELIFFISSIGIFIFSLYVFNKWLSKYTSWNLVNNNV
jgi:ABC-2 type transport system permease protein